MAGANASSLDSKVDASVRNQLKQNKRTGWTSVILKLANGLQPEHKQAFCELETDLYRRIKFINSVAVRVPNRNLAKVAALPFVERVSADATVRKYDEFTTGRTGADMTYENYNLTGQGVTIAIIDSGIDTHPDLNDPRTGRSRVVAATSFVKVGGTNDLNGHGTHVAGIMAGNGTASTGKNFTRSFYGIARKANLVSVRVLDGLGRTNVSTAIAGLQWVVQNRKAYNIRVVNLSIGHAVGESYTTDPLCLAVEKAWKSGLVVVVAAGNDGRKANLPTPLPIYGDDNEGYGTSYGSIASPANSPYAITVGAMRSVDGKRENDAIATYSSRGPSRLDFVLKPDIVAPGNRVVSLRRPLSFLDLTSLGNIVPVKSYRRNPPLLASSDYFELSGTSMAAPVVSGAAALLLEANPGLSPDSIKARLMASADKWADKFGEGDATAFGAGYLNIPEALQSRLVAKTWAKSPFLAKEADGTYTISKQGVLEGLTLWGTGLLGFEAVWGNKAVGGGKPAFNGRAMWGIDEVWADRAMWGIDDFQINLGIITLFGE
ncbi:MAG: S8 family peptidase [Chlorobia bacterium]|nr:S8 family peptidase [Fimbriimonadaceae bacterium]